MCEFCTQHGEGKKWYLLMENYSSELARELGVEPYADGFARNFEGHGASIARLDSFRSQHPRLHSLGRPFLDGNQKKVHFGQVVPIEDLERVLELQDSIVRLPCVCRRMTTGRDLRYCLGFGRDMAGILGRYPDYQDGLETMTREEAQAYVRELDGMGLVHSVWTFKTPFIGAVCNCDRDCLAYRLQVEHDLLTTFFPAEFVAEVDGGRCTGCRACLTRCQFGALRWSSGTRTVTVDPHKCYGCGLCRVACDRGAIDLQEREGVALGGSIGVSRRLRGSQSGPTVFVEAEACTSAGACRRCLEECPSGVFGAYPLEARAPGIRAGRWSARPVFPSACTGCRACEAFCPEGAITVGTSRYS